LEEGGRKETRVECESEESKGDDRITTLIRITTISKLGLRERRSCVGVLSRVVVECWSRSAKVSNLETLGKVAWEAVGRNGLRIKRKRMADQQRMIKVLVWNIKDQGDTKEKRK